MRIVNLIEDTKGNNECLYEHGLSFYVETTNHKLLVDTGASDAFIKNAEILGIDLTQVDTVIISHGHYDHTGGLLSFVEINPNADIYIHKRATGEFYNAFISYNEYIGMDKAITDLPQVHFLVDDHEIDQEICIFSDVKGRRLWPESNMNLKVMENDQLVQDEFSHEQYVVISDEGQNVLISGCAHNGILNILDKYVNMFDDVPDIVISGFHMVKKGEYTGKDIALIKATAAELSELDITYYTGHCTGEYPMAVLSSELGDKLKIIHSGDVLVQ